VEGFSDGVISVAAAAREIVSRENSYDAVLVACYSDHPLIKVLHEELDKPVIGIMEASLFVVRALGNRFGIIGICDRSKFSLEELGLVLRSSDAKCSIGEK
jgi:Asp/Glu/hydantoin racemase